MHQNTWWEMVKKYFWLKVYVFNFVSNFYCTKISINPSLMLDKDQNYGLFLSVQVLPTLQYLLREQDVISEQGGAKFFLVHEQKVQGGKKLQNSDPVLLIDTTEYDISASTYKESTAQIFNQKI